MREVRAMGWARGIGFLVGIAVAAAAVLGWRIPPGNGTLGTDLIVASTPTGVIQVSSPGPFVSGTAMHPGPETGGPVGSMEIRNIAGQTLAVGVRASANIPDLNSLLWFEVDVGERELFRGPLGKLVQGTTETFTLAPSTVATIDVRAWIPPSVASGYEGRIASVDLTFETVAPARLPNPGAEADA